MNNNGNEKKNKIKNSLCVYDNRIYFYYKLIKYSIG